MVKDIFYDNCVKIDGGSLLWVPDSGSGCAPEVEWVFLIRDFGRLVVLGSMDDDLADLLLCLVILLIGG